MDQQAAVKQAAPSAPGIAYIHHLKFPVTELARSQRFYEQVFGARLLPDLTHYTPQHEAYAIVLQLPNFQPLLELWLSEPAAHAQAGYDFLTLAVQDRAALRAWMQHLDALHIEHSGELTAIDSWLVVFEDPDGHRLRFYSLEEHPVTTDVSTDQRWLG